MRLDALGFFWRDEPPKPKKEAPKKRSPPEPVWLKPDYLPYLDEALEFPIHIMTDREIMQAALAQERLIVDTEIYWNYFCAVYRSLKTGHAIVFEDTDEYGIDLEKHRWILENFTTVSFNGLNFDLPLLALHLDGYETEVLKSYANKIILENMRGYEVLRENKLKPLPIDHIDLIEVAPLRANLKTYGGRLHVPRMQDLPFHPETRLTSNQAKIVRWYCVNDTTSTAFLHECLKQQIDLRYVLSNEHKIDLRSRSDAQIAEAIIAKEWRRLMQRWPRRQEVDIGTVFYYNVPTFLNFQTPLMQSIVWRIANAQFIVDFSGVVAMPVELEGLEVRINNTTYRIGVGGLHSCEKSLAHFSDQHFQLFDYDVTSYYPAIILKLGLFPPNLGPLFLQIYGGLVARRIEAKRLGNKEDAETLKITVNGTYGKLGSPYSIVYAPNLSFQVTLTGQLCLLLLAERLELAGIPVVSANTDGVMIKCPRHLIDHMKAIVAQWRQDTGLETETSEVNALYSRDVNNYIAIKKDGSVKLKGAYSNPWNDKKLPLEVRLHKNPQSTICIEAVQEFLMKGTPLHVTIDSSKEITKFVTVRTVRGGAVKNGEYLGSSIRWYYSSKETGEIVYAKTGNKVPKSDGAKPLMTLPSEFPDDVDFARYLKECQRILEDIGYITMSA